MAATLGGVMDHLEILRVVLAPAGLETQVTGLVVHDPVEVPAIETGDIVLAVGVDVTRPDAVGLIKAAGAGRAAAVVLKLRDGPAPQIALTTAGEAGVALLAIDRDVAWGHLYTLLRTATASLGVEGAHGPGGVAVGDLFTLANAVAAMVGGPTTIENPQSIVLAYSSLDEPIDEPRRETILGRRVPAAWLHRLQEDGVFRRLWSGDDVVRLTYAEPSGFRTRLAIAVRAGGQILGSIWVAEGRVPLGDEAEAALREAARIAALHLVRHQVGDDLERRRGSDLFRSVLEGRRPPELLTELSSPAGHRFATVIAFELRDAGPADLAVQGERLAGLIELYAQAYRHRVVCTGIGRVVYMLVTDVMTPDPAQLRRLATAIVEQSRESLRMSVHAGIGPAVPGVEGAPASRRDADLVLRALTEQGGLVTVSTLEDISPVVVLLRLRDLAVREPSLLAGKLDVLAGLDAKGRTSYLATLRAYLDALGQIPVAAGVLDVHPNTYRYRLRRLVALAGIDLSDPVERLILHLQLHLRPPPGPTRPPEDGRPGPTSPPHLSNPDEV